MVSFTPALRGEFIDLDDDLYVTGNPHVQAGLAWPSIQWAFQAQAACNWHPVTWLSHMLDCQLFGLAPWGHHFTNLCLHALNTILLFVLFRQMTGTIWRSFFVAALFGLHPLHVESVAWASERKDVLSTFFLLLALAAYVRYAQTAIQRPRPGIQGPGVGEPGEVTEARRITRHTAIYYGLSLAVFALGLMSKPMLVTFPFLLLLLDFWPLRRWAIQEQSKKLLVLEKTPFFLLASVSCVITFLVQKHGGAVLSTDKLPLGLRLDNAWISYCRYLGKLFWPSDLALFYPHPQHWPWPAVILAAVCIIALCGLALVLWRRAPYWAVGWFWFMGTLVPVLGLVQVGRQAMADRYMYIPSIGIFLVVVWGAWELRKFGPSLRTAVVLAGAGVVLTCGLLARHQAGYWRANDVLWRHALEVTRDNWMAHLNLGLALKRQGLMKEAGQHFIEAARLKPSDPETHGNVGNFLLWQGRGEESIREYETALRLRPDTFEVHHNLGIALCRLKRFDEGITHFEQALRLRPDSAATEFYLAMGLASKGYRAQAISHLEAALRLRPGYPAAQEQLRMLRAQGAAGS